MESLDEFWHDAHRENALRYAPDQPVTRIQPTPVRVHAITGHAIAYTPTHVLVEWEAWGEWHVRWETKWQVWRVE